MKNNADQMKISYNIRRHLSLLGRSKVAFMSNKFMVCECGTDCSADCHMEGIKHNDCDQDCRDCISECISECKDDCKEIQAQSFINHYLLHEKNNNLWFNNKIINNEGPLNLNDKDDFFTASYLNLAEQQEDYQTALVCINHLLQKSTYQQSSTLIIKRAFLYYKVQDFCGALSILDKVLSDDYNNIIALMIRVKVYVGMQNYKSALIDLERILSIENNAQFATVLYSDIKAKVDNILKISK